MVTMNGIYRRNASEAVTSCSGFGKESDDPDPRESRIYGNIETLDSLTEFAVNYGGSNLG